MHSDENNFKKNPQNSNFIFYLSLREIKIELPTLRQTKQSINTWTKNPFID